MDVSAIPFAAGLARRSVYDLDPELDAYGREIFVGQWDQQTRKPVVWYQFNKQGVLAKYVRRPQRQHKHQLPRQNIVSVAGAARQAAFCSRRLRRLLRFATASGLLRRARPVSSRGFSDV